MIKIMTILDDAENEIYVNPNAFVAAWVEEDMHGRTVGWVMFGTFKFKPLACLSDVVNAINHAIEVK